MLGRDGLASVKPGSGRRSDSRGSAGEKGCPARLRRRAGHVTRGESARASELSAARGGVYTLLALRVELMQMQRHAADAKSKDIDQVDHAHPAPTRPAVGTGR